MTELLDSFVVSIVNLKLGKHTYDFNCDEAFFKEYNYSLVKSGNLKCRLELEKQREILFTLALFVEGTLELACDTCLDLGNYPINEKYNLILKLVDSSQLENNKVGDDLIVMPIDTHQIDLKPFFFEMITLSIPMKVTCELINKECNPEMLKYLLNKSADSADKTNDSNDPRWDILNKLK